MFIYLSGPIGFLSENAEESRTLTNEPKIREDSQRKRSQVVWCSRTQVLQQAFGRVTEDSGF
jgi:hypothetical protein